MFLLWCEKNWINVRDNDLIKILIYSSTFLLQRQLTATCSLSFILAISMIVACASFPFGWNSDEFRKICGPDANRFDVGLCGIRWAYALAIIGESLMSEIK